MTNLILCGGAGTRLWPLSRNSLPKQFYPLLNGRSLFEETVNRNKALVSGFSIASNQLQMSLAVQILKKCGISDFTSLIEPVGRNTAPAIALISLMYNEDDILFVTPSDHQISNQAAYEKAVLKARALAEAGYIVTFGINPSYPETGFGYIEAEGEEVISFKEKPDLETAKKYISSGRYTWNSGMFVFKVGTFLDELKKLAPELYELCLAVSKKTENSQQIEPSYDDMMSIPAQSIDYAVLEKSKMVRVVSCDFEWNDLGSFDALYDAVEKNDEGVQIIGSENPILINAENNLIISKKRKVALIDVEELIIVDTEEALLIVKKGSSQKVKQVVAEIKKTSESLL